MFGSEILDVAIGLIFVYLVVSVLCSAVREGIESWLKTRAAYLEHGIRQLLQDMKGTGLAKSVFEHPLIFGLFTSSRYEPGTSQGKPSLMQRGRDLPSRPGPRETSTRRRSRSRSGTTAQWTACRVGTSARRIRSSSPSD